MSRRSDPQSLLVSQERLGVELRNLLGCLALGQGGGDHLVLALLQHLLAHVAHVGDVLDVDDAEVLKLKGTADPVGHEVGAHVADVGVAVDCGPAGVHPDDARLQGLQLFRLPGKGIVESHIHTTSQAGARALF